MNSPAPKRMAAGPASTPARNATSPTTSAAASAAASTPASATPSAAQGPLTATTAAAGISLPALCCYGSFAVPLAMLALPLYVYLPQFYALRCQLSLALIGSVLLAARLLAAFMDPLLGWWITHGGQGFARIIVLALPLLALGMSGLLHPPAVTGGAAIGWLLASLLVLYPGLGLAMIAHQSWGAALGGAPALRTRISSAREAGALSGVLLATGISASLGYAALNLCFLLLLVLGSILLLGSQRLRQPPHCLTRLPARPLSCAPANTATANAANPANPAGLSALWLPLRQPRFRHLFIILLINGIAAAIPATLFLFYTDDHLHLPQYSGPFLLIYFLAAACSMPLWVRLALKIGEARAWLAAMLLACAVFIWTFSLGSGASTGFGLICLLSGLTLGADLALPPALLTAVIHHAGHGNSQEAAYFGLWNWGVQINLALAAGIVLPLLAWLGYNPGHASNTGVLAAAYALLPCALKLLAALLLWRAPLYEWKESN